MSKGWTRVALAAVLAAALVAAGCGGDDDGGSISKDEFIAEANQICATGDEQLEAEAGDVFTEGEPSEEEIDQFVTDVVIPNLRDQIDAIRDLGAPEGDEEEVEAIVDAADEGIAELEQDPSAIQREGGGLDEASRLAGEYGLDECAT